LALDLQSEAGLAALRRLVARAHVIIDQLGIDRLKQLGLPHEEILQRPDVVVTAITPFGLSGPCRDLNASDLVVVTLEDERFSTRERRGEHAAGLRQLLQDGFAQRSKHEICHAAQSPKIPASMVATVDDVLA
jgi:crotonobetainyl-CoA:carnitine CoA-transferase CaiB-like acyl-CoA transferase